MTQGCDWCDRALTTEEVERRGDAEFLVICFDCCPPLTDAMREALQAELEAVMLAE